MNTSMAVISQTYNLYVCAGMILIIAWSLYLIHIIK